MTTGRRRRGNVAASARATIANVSEFGRAFEGGAGRDIRMEQFAAGGVAGGRVGTPVVTPAPGKRAIPMAALLILAVVLLASG